MDLGRDRDRDLPIVVGRYALYDRIAAGGMATVHLGRLLGPVGFSRTIAIKRMLPQFVSDPGFVSMFVDEARLASRIRHPNVVPTLDVVTERGELFLVLEYVHGETLSRLIKSVSARKGRISPDLAGAIVCGMLHGLHAAHNVKNERGELLGLVHRDVSPQNVLVGIDGVARLLDFGVAKAAGRMQITTKGQVKGKLAYMAPEQARGTVVPQSDVYAASAVLWEALTCQRLFPNITWQNVAQVIRERQIDPPSHFVSDIPRGLDAIVMKGLEKQADKRFATALEMALAIEDCLHIASAHEVGKWVAETAGEVLEERAHQIAEIESRTSESRLAIASKDKAESRASEMARRDMSEMATTTDNAQPSAPALATDDATETSSGTPFTQVSERAGSSETRSAFRRRALLATATVALVVLALVLGTRRTRTPLPLPAAPIAHQDATTPSPVVTPPVLPPVDPPASGVDPASLTIDSPETASSSAPADLPPNPVRPASKRVRPAMVPKRRNPCSSPFTIDANHVRRYRPECL